MCLYFPICLQEVKYYFCLFTRLHEKKEWSTRSINNKSITKSDNLSICSLLLSVKPNFNIHKHVNFLQVQCMKFIILTPTSSHLAFSTDNQCLSVDIASGWHLFIMSCPILRVSRSIPSCLRNSSSKALWSSICLIISLSSSGRGPLYRSCRSAEASQVIKPCAFLWKSSA